MNFNQNLFAILRAAFFALIAVLYIAIPNARPDFTRFNCNDSESYLSLAWNLSHGRGYTRSLAEGIYIPHTTWPPGTPLLLLPAVELSGRTINWFAVKWTICGIGLVGVIFSWFYLRKVTGNAFLADLGAMIIGLNPFYWDFSHQAMAELPLLVWMIGGLLLVDHLWANREVRWYESMFAGFVCGLAMLIKGQGGGLIFAPIAYLWGPRKCLIRPRVGALMWLLFLLAFTIPQVTWMARNRTVPATGFDGIGRFRSILAINPNDAESPLVDRGKFVERLNSNIRDYAIFRLPEQIIPGLWSPDALNWSGSGLCAVMLSIALFTLAFFKVNPKVFPVVFATFPMVLLNIAYAFGGSPRFWLPISVMLVIIIIINAGPFLLLFTFKRYLMAVFTFVLLANLVVYIIWHEKHPFNEAGPWREFAELCEELKTKPNLAPVGVFTPNPEAVQLMTGYAAPWGKSELLYDYAIIDSSKYKMPPDGEIVISKPPWVFISLPVPMTRKEISQLIDRQS